MADAARLRFLFRFVCCVINVLGLGYHCTKMDLEAYQVFGGRFKFLTFINMVLQCVYFTSVTALELQAFDRKRKHNETFSRLSSICEFFFASLAFPIGLTVCVLFWGLYFIDPYSCQSEEAAKLIPQWLNHYMHTFTGITVVLEVLLFKHVYPRKSSGIGAVLGFGVSYMAWVFLIAYKEDYWVYPFLEKMNLAQIGIFFIGAAILLVIHYTIGERLANMCHFMERAEMKSKKKN